MTYQCVITTIKQIYYLFKNFRKQGINKFNNSSHYDDRNKPLFYTTNNDAALHIEK